jgi:hypothetical protein
MGSATLPLVISSCLSSLPSQSLYPPPIIFLCLVPQADSLSVRHQSWSLPPPACFYARLEFFGHCGLRLGVLPPSSIGFIREQARPARFLLLIFFSIG